MASTGIIVVGGGLGIGQKATEHILDASSAHVLVFSLHLGDEFVGLQKKYSERLWLLQGDATSSEDRERAVKLGLEKMGRVDTLLITAGVMGEIQRIENGDPAKLRHTFEVNAFAPIFMCQLLLPELRRIQGRIIILSSAVDREIKYAGWLQYCASKAALTRFIEILGHEEPMIDVCGVYPGLTRTSMPEEVIAGKFTGIMFDEEVQRFKNWDATGEIEPPEWAAAAVAILAVRPGKLDKSGQGKVKYYYEYVQGCKDGFQASSPMDEKP